MEMIETIKKDYISAFKSKNSLEKNLLGLIKSDIEKLLKSNSPVNDKEVIKIIQKMQKSLKEMLASESDKNSDRYKETSMELEILDRYLPKMLSREEVVSKIEQFKVENPDWNIGSIMKFFSDKPVDRKMISDIINQKK